MAYDPRYCLNVSDVENVSNESFLKASKTDIDLRIQIILRKLNDLYKFIAVNEPIVGWHEYVFEKHAHIMYNFGDMFNELAIRMNDLGVHARGLSKDILNGDDACQNPQSECENIKKCLISILNTVKSMSISYDYIKFCILPEYKELFVEHMNGLCESLKETYDIFNLEWRYRILYEEQQICHAYELYMMAPHIKSIKDAWSDRNKSMVMMRKSAYSENSMIRDLINQILLYASSTDKWSLDTMYSPKHKISSDTYVSGGTKRIRDSSSIMPSRVSKRKRKEKKIFDL